MSCSRFSSEQAVNDMKTDARKAPKKVFIHGISSLKYWLYSRIVLIIWLQMYREEKTSCAIFVFHIVFFVIRFN